MPFFMIKCISFLICGSKIKVIDIFIQFLYIVIQWQREISNLFHIKNTVSRHYRNMQSHSGVNICDVRLVDKSRCVDVDMLHLLLGLPLTTIKPWK